MEQNPLKKCPQCQTDIPEKAKICPNCKSDIRSWAARNPILLLLIATPFLIGFISSFSGGTQSTPDTTLQAPSEIIAFAVSEGVVEKMLKAPSTAKFSQQREVDDLGEGRYRVKSFVDSQNGFGAMIRSDWETVLKYNSGDPVETSSWTIEKVVIDGEVVYENS